MKRISLAGLAEPAAKAADKPAHSCMVCVTEGLRELNDNVSSIVKAQCESREHSQSLSCPIPECKIGVPHAHIASPKLKAKLASLEAKRVSREARSVSLEAKPVAKVVAVSRSLTDALNYFTGAASSSPVRTPDKQAILNITHQCAVGCSHSAAPAAPAVQPSPASKPSPLSGHVHSGNCCSGHEHSSPVMKLVASNASATNTQPSVSTANTKQAELKQSKTEEKKPELENNHVHEENHAVPSDEWKGLAGYIDKAQMHPQLQKAAYLTTSIAAATPFGELFAGLGLPELANKLLSPLLGVSAMQGVMHGKDRLTKFFWILPIVAISSLASLANIPRLIRRVVTVALLQAVEFMRDPKSHKHGDHFHGDTEPRLKYLVERFKDKAQQKHFLQALAKLEVTINSSIPLANLSRSQIGKRIDNKVLKRLAGWTTWLVTLVTSIMGLDLVGDKIIALLNKRSGDKENQDLVAREAALACGSCGGIHVEAACPTVIAEESALAAVA